MTIVSQDKCNFVNFDNVINIGLEERSTLTDVIQITAETSGHAVILGKYEEKRAKAILQEIVKTYVLSVQYKVEDERTRMKLIMEGILLYEMPEK